jgi:TolA-binding protein
MSTGKYDEAMFALENIKNKGKSYKSDLERTTFMLGTELFNKMDYEEAVVKFKKAADLNSDKKVTAESLFWLGESYYRLNNYQLSYTYYKKFLDSRKSKSLPVYDIAFYNIGYVYFKRKEYANALNYFKRYLSSKPGNLQMAADAALRAGDSYFVMKQYDNAISYYDKGIKMQALDVDYGLYQKALALGVLQRYDEKVIALNKILNGFPNSSLYGKALYELGNTYLIMNNNEKALLSYKRLIKERPTSPYSVKARLKSGLIYYNGGQNEIALATFKKVVSSFPGTPESKEALSSIRNIYIDMNRAEDYFTYAAGLSFANVTPTEQDSVMYITAENQYLDGNTQGAITSLTKYLEKFPDGAYKTNAEFYLAECLYSQDKKNESLKYYKNVLTAPRSEFTETALYKAATISYANEDYAGAAPLFARLEEITEKPGLLTDARYWQMKSYLKIKDYENALVEANRLLSTEKIEDNIKLDALMVKAKAFLSAGELALAQKSFSDIVKLSQGEAGAEAKYNVAEIEFLLKNYKEAETTVFALVNDYSGYDYWVAKGFILLGDIYTRTGNLFQAKQTFQSIIDNYDGEDLRDIAKKKLNEIIETERIELDKQKAKDSVLTVPDTISIKGEPVELQEF